MSKPLVTEPLPQAAASAKPELLPRGLLWVLPFVIALGAGAFFALLGEGQATRAWQIALVNFLFWSGVAMGGVAIAAIFQVAGARWARPVQRLATLCALYLPISFLFFLGIWFGRHALFAWTSNPPPAIASWLNARFFFLREAAGLLLLYSLSLLFFFRSQRQDAGTVPSAQNPAAGAKTASLQKLAVGLLIVYAAVYSLLAWDFVMSLDPAWSSTLFGAFYFIGNLYLGFASLVVLAVYARWRFGLETVLDSRIFHNLGKLLFGFSLLWTYLFYSQYLVIWYGNLPHETGFVLLRTAQQPWSDLAVAVLAMNFLVPFVFLMPRSTKENPKTLLGAAVVIFAGMWLERYLLVVPSLTPVATAAPLGWAEWLITLGFGATFALTYLTALSRTRILCEGSSPRSFPS